MGRRDRRQFEVKRKIAAGRIYSAQGKSDPGSPPGWGRAGGHDHAMDDIRYFAATVACRRTEGFFAGAVERGGG